MDVGLSGFGRARLQDVSCLGIPDEELEARIKKDGLRILDPCPITRDMAIHNTQFHWVSGWTFLRCFGAPDPGGAADGNIWSIVFLSTKDNEPVWDDYSSSSEIPVQWYDAHDAQFTSITNASGPGGHGTAPWYSFRPASYEIETHAITSEDFTEGVIGLRAIYRTVRFLWFPWQAVSASIRSIYLMGQTQTTSWSSPWDGYGNAYATAFARIRFKNDAGVPVTWSKNNRETLLLDYTMRLVSM